MRNAVFGLFLIFVAGCGAMEGDDVSEPASTPKKVTGTVSFKERILLRPGTVVEVKLLKTSPADAPSTELATQVIENPSAPPIPFELEYDSALIHERMSYGVRAKVMRGDRLIMTSDTHYPVLTRGAGNSVDLMLVSVKAPTAKPNATLMNTYWKLVSIGGEAYQHELSSREPHLQFGKQKGMINGFTGCNDFFGSYAVEGNQLTFEGIGATQKACIKGMDIEQAYMQNLKKVNKYKITGDTLSLNQNETTVLEFEAVYLQ